MKRETTLQIPYRVSGQEVHAFDHALMRASLVEEHHILIKAAGRGPIPALYAGVVASYRRTISKRGGNITIIPAA